MTDQILFDKLVYMDRLKAAGIAEEQARAHADAMNEALREAVATKADARDIKAELTTVKAELKTEIGDLRASIKVMDGKIYAVLAVVVLSAIKLFWPH
jgi:hypothetical protein